MSFAVQRGETFGIIGESGSGKSTLGRALVCLHEPTAGRVLHDGRDPLRYRAARIRTPSPRFQIVFQDPSAALDPRMTIARQRARAARAGGSGRPPCRRGGSLESARPRRPRAPSTARRYPHELSGGQKQRANIARALALEPEADRLRRGGGGARRVDPGRHPQSLRRGCERILASPTSSSPTISASSRMSATGSRSCISAASSNSGRPRR